MINQLFILSKRGDKLLKRDFRNDLSSNLDEIFFNSLITTNKPIFTKNVTCSRNVSPATIVCALNKLTLVLTDFLKELTEEIIRQNFILAYEIVEEFFDFGWTQMTNTIDIEDMIESHTREKNKLTKIEAKQNKGISGLIPKKMFTFGKGNEPKFDLKKEFKENLFLDIIEEVSLKINKNGWIINSELNGNIAIKANLKKKVLAELKFTDQVIFDKEKSDQGQGLFLDDYLFDNAVDFEEFEDFRKIKIKCSRGTQPLMKYRLTQVFFNPFKFHVFDQKNSETNHEFVFKISAEFSQGYTASNFQLLIDFPDKPFTIKLSSPEKEEKQTMKSMFKKLKPKITTKQKWNYNVSTRQLVWDIDCFIGGDQQTLVAIISANKDDLAEILKKLNYAEMKFSIANYTISGVRIDNIKLNLPPEQNKAIDKWVKYTTVNKSYKYALQQPSKN